MKAAEKAHDFNRCDSEFLINKIMGTVFFFLSSVFLEKSCVISMGRCMQQFEEKKEVGEQKKCKERLFRECASVRFHREKIFIVKNNIVNCIAY